MLWGNDDTNTAFRDDVLELVDDDGVETHPPSHKDVKGIMRLKNYKAAGPDGLPAELFMARGKYPQRLES